MEMMREGSDVRRFETAFHEDLEREEGY